MKHLLLSMLFIASWNYPPDHLRELKWKNRVLLLFAARGSDAQASRQLAEMRSHEAEFKDRDVLVFTVAENDPLREKFKITTDSLTILLIGKDGTEKLRRHVEVPAQEILKLIDNMPMRRAGDR